MCILLKLHYAKFDVSRLFCSKVIKGKPLGALLEPPDKGMVKRSLKLHVQNLATFRLKNTGKPVKERRL